MRHTTKTRFTGRIVFSILPIVAIMLYACSSSTPRLEDEDVEQIIFYAIPRHTEFFNGIHSFEDLLARYGGKRDTLITDRQFIKEYVSLLNNLRPTRMESVDIRMATKITMKNGEIATVCLGALENRAIIYNGKCMKPDDTLFNFILNNAYAPLLPGYWEWEFKRFDTIKKDSTQYEEMVPYDE